LSLTPLILRVTTSKGRVDVGGGVVDAGVDVAAEQMELTRTHQIWQTARTSTCRTVDRRVMSRPRMTMPAKEWGMGPIDVAVAGGVETPIQVT
jgi:hypothetical protein